MGRHHTAVCESGSVTTHRCGASVASPHPQAAEEARLAREWEGMREADKEARDERARLERERAERLRIAAEAEAARMREEADKAAEVAQTARTEKDILQTQMEALRFKLKEAQCTFPPAAAATTACSPAAVPVDACSPWRACAAARDLAETAREEAMMTVRAVTEGAESPTAAAQPASDPWVEVDDGQGNKYFYNNDTGESAWEKPVQRLQAMVKMGMFHGIASADTAAAGGDDAYAAGQGVEQAASAAGDGASAAAASPWHAVDDGEGNTCVGVAARWPVPCCMAHAACLCVIQVLLQRSDWREQLGAAPGF